MIAAAIVAALAGGPLPAIELADRVRLERAMVVVEADRMLARGELVESWDWTRATGHRRLLAVRGSR